MSPLHSFVLGWAMERLVEPSRRPDGRYGKAQPSLPAPIRSGCDHLHQISRNFYLESLENWESIHWNMISASLRTTEKSIDWFNWSLGWEVWLDGMEITPVHLFPTSRWSWRQALWLRKLPMVWNSSSYIQGSELCLWYREWAVANTGEIFIQPEYEHSNIFIWNFGPRDVAGKR